MGPLPGAGHQPPGHPRPVPLGRGETRGDSDFPPDPLETARPGGLRAPYSGLHPRPGAAAARFPTGGVSKGEGPQPRPFVSLGGVGAKSKRLHVSGGGRRGRCLCAKDISPCPPRPPCQGGGLIQLLRTNTVQKHAVYHSNYKSPQSLDIFWTAW